MRRQENLKIRRSNFLKEVRVRNKSRIDKKKYYGIGVNIKDYQKLIIETLYDKDLLERELKSEEGLSDYFHTLNERLLSIKDDIRAIIFDTMKKGSKRVQDKDGNVLKFEELEDTGAVDIITNQQFDYLKNVTQAQHEKIRQDLVKGKERGLSVPEISQNIQKSAKQLTEARANTIARSELVKSHNLGQVNTMKQMGATQYIYWTAQDKKVSNICKKLQGYPSKPNVYDLDKAGKGHPLPVKDSHPNCRCCILIKD